MAEKAKKTTKKDSATELMSKTISNLTDVVAKLQNDVNRIKVRMGI